MIRQRSLYTVDSHGAKVWQGVITGEVHRENGPAIERKDGSVRWALNGHYISSSEQFMDMLNMTEDERVIYLLKWGRWDTWRI